MKFNASQIAMMLQGTLEGNDVAVGTLSKIEEGKEGSLSFSSQLMVAGINRASFDLMFFDEVLADHTFLATAE